MFENEFVTDNYYSHWTRRSTSVSESSGDKLSYNKTCKLSADIAGLKSGDLQTCLKKCRRKAASSTASADIKIQKIIDPM